MKNTSEARKAKAQSMIKEWDKERLTQDDKAFNFKLARIGGNTCNFISTEKLQKNVEFMHTDEEFIDLSEELQELYTDWQAVCKRYEEKAKSINVRANHFFARSNK